MRMLLAVFVFTVCMTAANAQEKTRGPVKVLIEDEKASIVEPEIAIDPVRRIVVQSQPNLGVRLTVENKALHLGYIYTMLKIDDRVQAPGRVEINAVKLGKTVSGKERDGFTSVVSVNKVRITQTVEIVPTQALKGQARRRDAALVRYLIENGDSVPHTIGVRIGMDVFLVDNDGALFAAPNHPNKVLDGIELKGKGMPEYLQVLQRPDLKNPGFVAHMTYALGNAIERPSRVILTGLGAGAPDNWNLQVRPAGGDSAMSVYWDPREIKPGGKRELGYAYGQGLAASLVNEGNIRVVLGGSFEPGKRFTIAAQVSDPSPGQSLTLELPTGLECIDGNDVQPVPPGDADGQALVLWSARVVKLGTYSIRVRSSNGVTQTKTLRLRSATEN